MLFDRHRKPKRLEDRPTPKKSSLADAFFRRLPIAFTRRTQSKPPLYSTDDAAGLTALPRQSASLPNVTIDTNAPSPRLADEVFSSLSTTASSSRTATTNRQQGATSNSAHLLYRRHSFVFNDHRVEKRHSIQPKVHGVSKLINDENDNYSSNKQRHSYTFGKQKEMGTLLLKDLALDPSQEKKLDLFLKQRCTRALSPPQTPNNTDSTPTIIMPQRSISQQFVSSPKTPLVRAHSMSSPSNHQQEIQYNYSSLDASTLADILDQQNNGHMNNIILIDVRSLVEFQKQRIRGSFNVNLPSLLIKRYQRGAVSNFHLENFITTAEGREHYLAQRLSATATDVSTLSTLPSPLHTTSRLSPVSTTSSAKVDPTNGSTKGTTWVVYDDDMNDQHKTTQAWTLLYVLCKAARDTNDQIHYLHGGIYGFIYNKNFDSQRWIEGIESDGSMNLDGNNGDTDMNSLQHRHSDRTDRLTLSTSTSSTTSSTQQKHLCKVSPRRSLSCTVGDRNKGQQQTSLFSLDTQVARENNANALAKRASRRSQQLQKQQLSIGVTGNGKRLSSATMESLQQQKTGTTYHSIGSNTQHYQSKDNDSNKNLDAPLLSIPSSASSSLASSYTQNQSSSFTTSLTSSTAIMTPPSTLSTTTSTSITSNNSSCCCNNNNNNNMAPLLARVMEEDDDDMPEQLTADISPRTETDFEFTISEIIPGFLYVGPEIETDDQADQLFAQSIRRVLNMAEECHDQPLQQNHNNLIYRKIAARDTVEMQNIDQVMMEAVGFIEEAKRRHEPIYVHCKAGKSRSVTAILAYLVSCERWTLKQSYRHVIKARPNMSPNIGFIAELMKLENQVHGRISSFMETDWHTTSLPSPGFSHKLEQLKMAWECTSDIPTCPPSSSVIDSHGGESRLF